MPSAKTSARTAPSPAVKPAVPRQPVQTRKTPPVRASGPAALPAPKPVAPAKPAKATKPAKPPKAPKLRSKPVRDSFTMPQADFALIAALKARMLAAGRETKKSELLRAGLHVLAALEPPALLAALAALAPVKIGRPKSGH